MTKMMHMADKATWDKAKDIAILSQDPLKLHKSAFLEYLDAKGRQMAESAEYEAIEAELRGTTAAWKQAAKAKARRR